MFHSHLSLVELLQKHRLSCASSTLVLDCSAHLWPRKPRGERHRQASACRGSGTGGLQGGWRGHKRTWTVVPCPLPSQALGVGNWGPGTEAATDELPLAMDKETGPQRGPLPERYVSTEHAVASRRPDSGGSHLLISSLGLVYLLGYLWTYLRTLLKELASSFRRMPPSFIFPCYHNTLALTSSHPGQHKTTS